MSLAGTRRCAPPGPDQPMSSPSSSVDCWIANPNRISRQPGSSTQIRSSAVDVREPSSRPAAAVPQPVRLEDYSRHHPSAASDGTVKHRLVSGRTQIDITRRTARLGSYERGLPPKRLPGPLPSAVICGNLMVGLVGDTVGDVRILERQDPEWLVTNHRPRPHLEPPHLCAEPRLRLVEEMWPGARLLAGAQESHAYARRCLRYVPVGFESVEPCVEPSTALSHHQEPHDQLHGQHHHQLGVWQPPEALGSSPPAWSQHEDVEPAFQQHWQQHWQQHVQRARLRG